MWGINTYKNTEGRVFSKIIVQSANRALVRIRYTYALYFFIFFAWLLTLFIRDHIYQQLTIRTCAEQHHVELYAHVGTYSCISCAQLRTSARYMGSGTSSARAQQRQPWYP